MYDVTANHIVHIRISVSEFSWAGHFLIDVAWGMGTPGELEVGGPISLNHLNPSDCTTPWTTAVLCCSRQRD